MTRLERQDWKAPQIKDLNLIIPGNYTFITYNNYCIAFVIMLVIQKTQFSWLL